MCGICGMAASDPRRSVDGAVLRTMNETIRHRGPDSDGFYVAPGVGLAARRLAIIDLVRGEQPVANEMGTIHAVFNGEIYNHRELRAELQAKGHRFASDVDTEVLVHLYEEHGAAFVSRLRGMFALAIWDSPQAKLLLARDRVGKKPLYYAVHDGALVFGSELKCLLEYPGMPRTPDLEAIHHFLTLQYVPDPWSAFVGVRKLPPAHTLTWHAGRLELARYWDLDFEPKLRLPDDELMARVRDAVTEAVRIRMISDVPLGAHLSGGIDSSIVVGIMARLGTLPVKTFSVGFREAGFSELAEARLAAETFGTDHHEMVITPDATEALPNMARHFDEPFADPAAIPLWYLSAFTRETVTVALNGDGGDEAFAGYQRYYADRIADLYGAIPGIVRSAALDPLLSLLPTDTSRPIERSYPAALRRLSQAAKVSHGASVVRWGSYFDEAEKAALYRDDAAAALAASPTAGLLEASFAGARARNRLDRTLYTDLHNYLPDGLLVKADRMTMAHSLEARSPFLDHRVLELAARLPTRWKVRGRSTKHALRTAFADLLPDRLRTRGKVGFGVPLGAWFRGPLRDAAHDLLLGRDSRTADYLRPGAVSRLLQENRAGIADNGKRIWALLNLETWLREYVPAAGGSPAMVTVSAGAPRVAHERIPALRVGGAADIPQTEES